ncbi:MAG: energy-coupling factor transporter transmembrane protein EcfT [Clostridia bacterium]|nr:energy-coupling factor transporter transmembrane protein EcfT [Clostridia bacterium]
MKDCFSTYHPVVNLVYFALVLGCAMFLLHPVCLVIALLCGAGYALCLNGKKALGLCLKGVLPMMVFAAVLNPIFSHEGVTILAWLPSGNPLTLESILYGLAAAGMLGGVVLWFSCFSAVITSDKFVYLFGRVIPALSLVLSMALRFVPRFLQQLKVVTRAQKCIGRDPSRGSLFHRVRCAGAILKIMISWALENGIDTADSMKSRGYGLPGRTAFSVYRFDRRDGQALAVIALLGGAVLAGAAFGGLTWRYFPSVKWSTAPLSLCVLAAYAALCAFPIILNRKEERKWKALRSKI